MQLSEEDIKEFIKAWEKDFGERISPETAESEAKRLIAFFLELAEAAQVLGYPSDLTK